MWCHIVCWASPTCQTQQITSWPQIKQVWMKQLCFWLVYSYKVPSSNLRQETSYPDPEVSGFSFSHSKQMSEQNCKTGHDCFLPYPSQFLTTICQPIDRFINQSINHLMHTFWVTLALNKLKTQNSGVISHDTVTLTVQYVSTVLRDKSQRVIKQLVIINVT